MTQTPCSRAVGSSPWSRLLGLLVLLLANPVGAQEQSDPEAVQLLRKSEALMRDGGSEGVYRVVITRPEWRRELRLRSIDDAPRDRYRLEMLEPRKVRGTVFLKRGERLSMYLPKLKREVAISPAMMHDPWMGSDFNNQDLIESSALIDQYHHRILSRDGDSVTIESSPRADAAVSWRRLEQRLRSDGLPLEIRYECKTGLRNRVLRFEEPRELGGHVIPTRWVMQPVNLPEQNTVIEVQEIQFGIQPPDELFEPLHPPARQTP
jgi:hypothetical protein